MERPVAGEGSDGPRACSAVVLGGVVGDVLADPLLAGAVEVHDGRLAQELGAGLQLQALERVPVDAERKVANGVVEDSQGRERYRHVACQPGVRDGERAVDLQCATARALVEPGEDEGGHGLAGYALRSRLPRRPRSISSPTSMLSGGGFVRRSPQAPSCQCARRRPRGRLDVVHALRDRRPAARRRRTAAACPCGSREPGSRASRRYSIGRGDVEDRLRARARDENRRRDERDKVGGDVGRRRISAVHAADAARAHEPDPDHPRHGEHPADRGGAHVARDRTRREVARAELPRIGVEALELVVTETDTDASVEDADRGQESRPPPGLRASIASPTSTPCGAGNPCATMVVSSATTARPSSRAARTSSESWMSPFTQRTLSASLRAAERSARLPRGRGRVRRRSSRPPARRPRRVVSRTSSTGSASSLVAVERAPERAALEDPERRRMGDRRRAPRPRWQTRRRGSWRERPR